MVIVAKAIDFLPYAKPEQVSETLALASDGYFYVFYGIYLVIRFFID